ncbi:MAG TPA: D-aminoacyl-tRNA deacylase [Acidimicrobiales bacterium]|nr:D-aminoacyl-tRNA deacylase [Acidimicrobiales bacterium]
MRAVLQRVSSARVRVEDAVVGEVGKGLCVLVGVTHSDTDTDARWTARKIAALRLFDDETGTMNLSLLEAGGSVLLVSQFTLYGDTGRGRRPSWSSAAPAAQAEPLVRAVADELRKQGVTVATGSFGAAMEVELVNEGPVTLLLET